MDKWIIKAALQKVMSALPASEQINYWFQRRITKNLPLNKDGFMQKAADAVRHFKIYSSHHTVLPETTFYEFGAGWDLAIPLVYYALGVRRQLLVDVRPNLQWELVQDTVGKISRYHADLSRLAGVEIRAVPPLRNTVSDLLEKTGIDYRSPCDAAQSGLASNSIDFISSTVTMEHIPEPVLEKILHESFRILKPQGVMSSTIDLQDHFSYFDSGISYYHFLQFSDAAWHWINSDLASQNRLRYPDYMRLVGGTPFEVSEKTCTAPHAQDLALLKSLPLAEKFRRYGLDDLGVRGLNLVLKKN
ncbi:MAG: class I SAM-dependent methyltransferase [Rhizobacter sp.]|nr:class I SAM-dependent methyltransferase [Chlorobiales bacterium]